MSPSHTPHALLDRRINLITGKGGVGRTTVAVAFAQMAALKGRNVLLAEIGSPEESDSPVGRCFGRPELTDIPVRVAPGVHACQLWACTGHELFARAVIPGGPLVAAALRSKALRRFMTAAPSFHELGILYHFLRLLEQQDERGAPLYDNVVVDMPATGHTLALTNLPEVALRVVPRGPVAEAMRRGQAFVNDARVAGAWIVTVPERLPVTEALELVDGLRASSVPVRGIILNRFLEDPFAPDERSEAEALLSRRRMRGHFAFERINRGRDAMARLAGAVPETLVPLREIPRDEGDPCAGLTLALTQAA